MTTHYPDTHHDPSSNAIFGFWIYLMTDCVMFATFFAGYAVLSHATYGGPTARDLFHLPTVLAETLVLMASSFTCGIALLAAPHKKMGHLLGGLALTFLLGALFLGFQRAEFSDFLSRGISWQTSAFLSAYFTLVGLHGLHILVGLGLMVLFAIQLIQMGFVPVVLRRLTCLRIYWQFLYLIWIFTFTIVYFIGAK